MSEQARIKGHWFCNRCDDIVFMSYEKITVVNACCPTCGHLACNFIPHALSRKIIPAEWFDAMRRAVADATNPELPDQRPHKQML